MQLHTWPRGAPWPTTTPSARSASALILSRSSGSTPNSKRRDGRSRDYRGSAPDEWETLTKYLRGRGHDLQDALNIGLLSQRDGGNGPYDRFRGRFIFPIRDRNGRVVGFGGRALRDDQQPKYLNTPQSPLF